MIPILDSTAVVASGSEGLRAGAGDTPKGSEGRQFGALLSAQEGVTETPDTAGEPILDVSDALATSGNVLPSGGKSLPTPLFSDLELNAETAVALEAVSAAPEPMPEALPEAAPPLNLDPLSAVPEEALGSAISSAAEVEPGPVQALDLEAAPPIIVDRGEQPAPLPAAPLPAAPLVLPPDALMRLINTSNAVGGDADRRRQGQLPAASLALTASPATGALASEPDVYQKGFLADAEFSLVAARAENSVEVADSLKGVELLPLKTAASNAPATPQPAGGALPAISEAATSAVGLKSGVAPPLNTPVGDPGWSGEFAARIGVMVKNGLGEASLQLSPAELGRLDIKISTEGDQAKVLFTVQNMAAREAIEQAMPRLREMLEQGGMQLAHSEVADHSQSRQHGDELNDLFAGESLAESEDVSQDMSSMSVTKTSDAMVDYYV